MIAKYAFNAFDEGNPFIVIPIAHGYFYIVYILTVLQLAVQKRISLSVIIALVAAGTIPLTSLSAGRRASARLIAPSSAGAITLMSLTNSPILTGVSTPTR